MVIEIVEIKKLVQNFFSELKDDEAAQVVELLRKVNTNEKFA